MLNMSEHQSTSMMNRARRNTLGDLLTRTAARNPHKQAFTFKERTVTYEQLDELVNQTAHGMLEKGIQKGDRLALLSKNSLDFVVVVFAAAKIGAVTIPINYMLRKNDIAYILKHAEVTALFSAKEYTDILDEATSETERNIEHYYVLEEFASIGTWQPLMILQETNNKKSVEADLFDDELAQVLYTSGTESNPKGVMLSHKSIISEYVSCVVDGKMSDTDVLVHALPFYHSAQLHVFLGPSIYLGASGIILDKADPAIIMETIEQQKATQLFAPPTVWIALYVMPILTSMH